MCLLALQLIPVSPWYSDVEGQSLPPCVLEKGPKVGVVDGDEVVGEPIVVNKDGRSFDSPGDHVELSDEDGERSGEELTVVRCLELGPHLEKSWLFVK